MESPAEVAARRGISVAEMFGGKENYFPTRCFLNSDRCWQLAASKLPSIMATAHPFSGDGEITKPLTVRVDKVSATAKAKIEAAGGKVEEPC